MLALSPKREEASKLGAQVEQVEGLARPAPSRSRRRPKKRASEFPVDYQQLVVLGKAVPGDDETASLLVQVNHIADHAGVRFSNLQLELGRRRRSAKPARRRRRKHRRRTRSRRPRRRPRCCRSGATIGPAGLAVMPYTLTFSGNFFQVADFIKGLDSLVKTKNEEVAVDGRLITIDGFSLAAGPKRASRRWKRPSRSPPT